MSSYKFAPLQSTGIFGGISTRQIVAIGFFLVIGYAAMRSLDSGLGLLAALMIAGIGFAATTMPVSGRPLVEWSDIGVRFLLRRISGRDYYSSAAPLIGHVGQLGENPEAPLDLPDAIADIEVLGAKLKGHEVGVAFDSSCGAYTATLAVTANDFALLDAQQQEVKLAAWSAVLSDLAREDSPICRLQWVEQTLPANQDELKDYLVEALDDQLSFEDPAVMSYVKLLSGAADVQQQHELLLTLRLETVNRKVRKMASRLGKGHEGYCALLLREIENFGRSLAQADVRVLGVLQPRTLARVIRCAYNPFESREQVENGVDPSSIGPMDAHEGWEIYRAEGALHVTYWIAEWPRVAVGPTFLSPLLLNTGATRAIGVTIEPVPLLKAMKDVQAAATSEEASAEVRESKGYRTGAAKRKAYESILEREAELASGHAEVRFAGFVTVTGRDLEELRAACAEVEHAASQSHLDLRRLSGEQETALTYTMPLARGLKTGLFA